MDHIYSPAVEEATWHIMGFVWEGQDAVQGWQGLGKRKDKGGDEVQEALGR